MSKQHLGKLEIEQVMSGLESSVDTLDHLVDCTQCQNELEKASADSWWFNEGRELIASTLKLQESIGTAPKLADIKGYDPIVAELKQLVDSFEPPKQVQSLGRVDEYDIESLLGVGGMGAVFKGFNRELNRHVAIKFLLPRHARLDSSRQRFSREAKSIAAVDHEHVIPVYRINRNASFPWFSMPLVNGVSLQQFVDDNGPLDPMQLVRISAQIAAGLNAAHEADLIHRDVKPANILLEDDSNRIVVTDFGLAREESDSGLTQTGMVMGTPQYMSPEQADGRKLDQRSDLFSLGSVMFFLATGQPPFHGENQLELLKNIREADVAGVREFNPGISVCLEQAIERLLARDPADRFQSAAEVKQFLDVYEAHLSSPSQNPEPSLLQIKRKRSTNLVRCAIAIAITLVAAMGIAIFNHIFSEMNFAPTSTVIPVIPCDPGTGEVVAEPDETDQAKEP